MHPMVLCLSQLQNRQRGAFVVPLAVSATFAIFGAGRGSRAGRSRWRDIGRFVVVRSASSRCRRQLRQRQSPPQPSRQRQLRR